MKKLVSLLSAVAMMAMLAVPASAALSYAPDEDGWVVIESAPTDAEVAAYAPTLAATATKLESEDALKAISSAVNKKFKSKLATHDIYKITYDMTDIGEFVNGYDEDYNNAFFGLYDITIGFDPKNIPEGFETYALTYTLPDGSTGAVGVGVSSVNGLLNAAYTAAGVSYDTIYPARTNDEGIVVDAGTYKAEYILAYPKTDAQVVIPHAETIVTYKTTVGSANSVPATKNITCADLVLGAPIVEDDTLKIEISDPMAITAGDVNGIAWDVAFKNFDSTKEYKAFFTSNGVERNPAGQRIEFDIETEADFSFAAILNKVQLGADDTVDFDIRY